MGNIVTIGVDLAKSVFQVHGIDAEGAIVVRRQLRRRQVLPFFETLPPCLVGMEACATSHHWAHEIEQFGHRVRLMPPRYVKAYVKKQKNDAADAEAVCEAVTRPTMRFVAFAMNQRTRHSQHPAIRFARGTGFGVTLVRSCYGLSGCWPPCTDLTDLSANGGFYFRAFNGSPSRCWI